MKPITLITAFVSLSNGFLLLLLAFTVDVVPLAALICHSHLALLQKVASAHKTTHLRVFPKVSKPLNIWVSIQCLISIVFVPVFCCYLCTALGTAKFEAREGLTSPRTSRFDASPRKAEGTMLIAHFDIVIAAVSLP